MTGNAIRRENLLAAGNQFGFRPLFIGIVGIRRHLLLLVFNPLIVVGLRQNFHDDGHECVILAAKFRALATVDAGFVGIEPGVAQESGDGVLFHAEIRNHPGVDDVGGGQDDADLLVHGDDQVVVHFHQVELALGLAILDLRARGRQRGKELDAGGRAVEVLVAPLPLVARDLHGDVGAGSVFHGDHGLGGRQRHGNDDDERNDRPCDFDTQVFVEGRGLVATGFAMRPDGVEHHPEYADEDHDTDREQHPMQPHDVARNCRHALMQVELIDLRAAGHVLHLSTRHAANQHRTSPQYPSPLLHAYLETRRVGPFSSGGSHRKRATRNY
ncbi:hypothetical protein D9M68_682970 [compost metagenome]